MRPFVQFGRRVAWRGVRSMELVQRAFRQRVYQVRTLRTICGA